MGNDPVLGSELSSRFRLVFVNCTSRLCNYRIIADELSVRTVGVEAGEIQSVGGVGEGRRVFAADEITLF
ncbi:unnamed protein product [Nippostrongylus brasiliensis]|uniref:Glutaredoxin domain-containing protein n=1 Tax=Nippostrongylus brasiliensis TaxID=27835 RepID=A0A0N4XU12_NIPBR|nr:unnamed protein product [Nippostrongylus brasiliensis]